MPAPFAVADVEEEELVLQRGDVGLQISELFCQISGVDREIR